MSIGMKTRFDSFSQKIRICPSVGHFGTMTKFMEEEHGYFVIPWNAKDYAIYITEKIKQNSNPRNWINIRKSKRLFWQSGI